MARGEAGARDEDDDGEDRDVGGVQQVDAVEVHLDDDARVPRDRGLHLREAQDPQQEVVEVAGRPDARDAAVVVELEREVRKKIVKGTTNRGYVRDRTLH